MTTGAPHVEAVVFGVEFSSHPVNRELTFQVVTQLLLPLFEGLDVPIRGAVAVSTPDTAWSTS